MLTLQSVNVELQGSMILRDVTARVQPGELIALVGRNGAGKTTMFRTIMGFVRPKAGSINYDGRSLITLKPHQIAQLGIAYSPEESDVFGDLTVAENVEFPVWTRKSTRPAAERVALAYRVFPQLEQYRQRGGQQLSGGERKMLSIARALALDPSLLLLDEPFEGLSPAIIPVIANGIASIRKMGHSILMAESNVHHLPDFTDRAYVIERGEVIFAGKVQDGMNDPKVRRIISG